MVITASEEWINCLDISSKLKDKLSKVVDDTLGYYDCQVTFVAEYDDDIFIKLSFPPSEVLSTWVYDQLSDAVQFAYFQHDNKVRNVLVFSS